MRKFNLKFLNDADDACPEVLKGATNPSRSQMQFLLKTVFLAGCYGYSNSEEIYSADSFEILSVSSFIASAICQEMTRLSAAAETSSTRPCSARKSTLIKLSKPAFFIGRILVQEHGLSAIRA